MTGAPGVGAAARSGKAGSACGSAGSWGAGSERAGAAGNVTSCAAADAPAWKTATSTASQARVTSGENLLRLLERRHELLEEHRVVALDLAGQEVGRAELVLAVPHVEEQLGRRLEEAVGVLVLARLDRALVLAEVHGPLLVVAEREVVAARFLDVPLVEALGQPLEDPGDLAHARP